MAVKYSPTTGQVYLDFGHTLAGTSAQRVVSVEHATPDPDHPGPYTLEETDFSGCYLFADAFAASSTVLVSVSVKYQSAAIGRDDTIVF